MSEKFYPRHATGVDDDVLVMMAAHHVSFAVHCWNGKLHVDFGPACGMQLTIEQAQDLRNLLDLGIADLLEALAEREAAQSRVDLVKAAA